MGRPRRREAKRRDVDDIDIFALGALQKKKTREISYSGRVRPAMTRR